MSHPFQELRAEHERLKSSYEESNTRLVKILLLLDKGPLRLSKLPPEMKRWWRDEKARLADIKADTIQALTDELSDVSQNRDDALLEANTRIAKIQARIDELEE